MFDRNTLFMNLRNPNITTFTVKSGCWIYTITKVNRFGKCFIYFTDRYYSRTDRDREDILCDMKFGGIYYDDRIYYPPYEIYRWLNENDYVSRDSIKDHFQDVAKRKILDIINFSPVEVTDAAKSRREVSEDHLLRETEYEVRKRYIEGIKTNDYPVGINPCPLSELEYTVLVGCEYIDDLVEERAMEYVAVNANHINFWIDLETRIRNCLAEIEACPSEHLYCSKRIVEAIKDLDCKTFTVLVSRANTVLETKIERRMLLGYTHSSWVASWNLGKIEGQFNKLGLEMGMSYGRASELYPEEILEIKFRGKTLYRKENAV